MGKIKYLYIAAFIMALIAILTCNMDISIPPLYNSYVTVIRLDTLPNGFYIYVQNGKAMYRTYQKQLGDTIKLGAKLHLQTYIRLK